MVEPIYIPEMKYNCQNISHLYIIRFKLTFLPVLKQAVYSLSFLFLVVKNQLCFW